MYVCVKCTEEIEQTASRYVYRLDDTVYYCQSCWDDISYEEYESIIFSKTDKSHTIPFSDDKKDIS